MIERRVSLRLVVLAVVGALLLAGAGWVAAQPVPDPAALRQRASEGERALAEGRYADAEAAYDALRRLSPGTAEVHARLGLIYFQQGKFAEAVVPLREALRLKPGLPKIDVLLAMSLSELGQYDEALPALAQAFGPLDDPVLKRMVGLHLQRSYTGLGRDREAVETALQMSRLYPDDPEVLYHSGRLFANFAYLQTMKLADVAPDSVWLHQAAGEANESQGLYDAALREYRQVLAMAPRRPGVQFRIGRVLLEHAKHDGSPSDETEARRAFEAELVLDPTNANAAYELAEIHRGAGELEPARQLFEQAVAHHPAFEHAQIGLARTLIALDRPADALPHLKAALDLNPDSSVAYYHVARANRALGDTKAQQLALAQFNRTRSLAAERAAAVSQVKQDVTPQVLDAETPR